MTPPNRIRVAELFAGVGGFRLGLEAANENLGDTRYQVVWSNQWEPSTKRQHASDIYIERFGPEGHSNEDIATVEVASIPDHDLLVGGFPCQDYSVARTLNQAAGLVGKKGVLWWEIHRVVRDKGAARPRYLLLENVDRLLKSPASQRGRDFAIMLASLLDLGYVVEWRVINAADYGMPQRRRRVFVLAYQRASDLGAQATASTPAAWLSAHGPMARAHPVEPLTGTALPALHLDGDLVQVTTNFRMPGGASPFENAGIAYTVDGERKVWSAKVDARYSGPRTRLGDVLLPESQVPAEYYIDEGELDAWRYLKGAKSATRTSRATGHTYNYTEGGMAFPDPLDRPSRTIVTGEGGRSPSRFKHVVLTPQGRYRRLTPVELERLNMFPPGHTAGASNARRAFLMGNALVVGVVENIARELAETISTSVQAVLVK